MKARYLVSCAVAAILSGGGGALAQQAPTQTSEARPPSGALEEVVVSAQRRDQSIQNVPLTVQALSGEQLEQLNVSTFGDLLKYTPNVTFADNGPGQGEIFMRGLSAGFRGNQSSATIANFPNVALYLDDESMQFPARNADVYMVDLQRVEVLEGPQGTLFGGGAEAGAIRYITNKPKLNTFEGNVEASVGGTSGGDPNGSGNFTLNIPLVTDRLALRVVAYDDHRGGYIDNVASDFTRSNLDLGNFYFGIKPTNGLCPNHLPAGSTGFCTLPGAPQANNSSTAGSAFNPVDYRGGRVSGLYQIDSDWSVLIAESLQDMHADGISAEYPTGSNFQPLQPLQITAFEPSYEKDIYENTAWTLNGKIADLNVVYTGAYMNRHIAEQMDYSNYSRSVGGMYYECAGGSTGFGTAAPVCYSPAVYWHDNVTNTHLTEEARVSTPDDWQLRGIAGAYWEQFRIYDVMNFDYKTIPDCSPENLAAALAGGPACVANVRTAPGSTATDPGVRGNATAFGEDAQRGYDQTAFFATVDYDIIPQVLTVEAGTRWFRYSEFLTGSQYATTTGCLDVPNGDCAGGMVNINAAGDNKRYYGFKNRFNITWHVDQDLMTYFTYSEGFRPGGFNRSVSDVATGANGEKQYQKPNSYTPDSLTNYEIGLKSELLDHRLLFNFSAYYMEWDNVQFLFFNPTELGNTTFGVNGPDYEVKGGEVQLIGRILPGLTAQGSVTYNRDSQTTSPCLVDNIAGTPAYNSCITQVIEKGVGLVPFVNPFGTIGSVPAFSPDWEGNVRLRYDFQVQDFGAFAQASGSYMGSMYNQPATYKPGTNVVIPNTTLLRYLQPAYATADASVGISRDNWYGEAFCTNLFDSHASMFTSSAQFIKSEVPIRPRVFGLKVGVTF